MFTPTTNLRLLSVPIESDYTNTFWFASVAEQTAYFTSKVVKTFDDFNYIKRDSTIVVAAEIDSLYNCNYIMYKNSNFSNRWFYGFINRMEWASNSSTRLYVSTDVIQTWFFDITYYKSYVDRCHSDTDVAGDNIVTEDFSGLAQGGYQQVGTQDLTPNKVDIYSTTRSDGSALPAAKNNNIISGAGLLGHNVDANADEISTVVNVMVTNGVANAISRIQQYPNNHDGKISFAKHPSSIVSGGQTYTPANKKLLSGAFLTAYITMYGQEINFNPEYVSGDNINATIGVDTTTGTVGVIVTNYATEQIPIMCLTAIIPESSWAYNQYKNDYNLHSTSNAMYQQRSASDRTRAYNRLMFSTTQSMLDAFSNGIGIAQGAWNMVNIFDKVPAATSLRNAIGSASSLIGNIGDVADNVLLARQYEQGYDAISQDLTTITENYNAPATGGVASSNIFLATGKTALSYGFKVPPLDIVKRCDKFLTVYGYKQSEYREINLHARQNWTYIKTNGLNASGNFPDDDMRVIKQVFNKGVFFWNSTATFGDFDQANPIV